MGANSLGAVHPIATQRPLLGLVGPTGAGKTTLARHLASNHGFRILHMGQPIKNMLLALGLSEESVAGTPEQRSAPLPQLGNRSARYALQTLGTDWGRRMISPDLWANSLTTQIARLYEADPKMRIVVDDLRFPNDWAVIRNFGGVIVTIRRPTTERTRRAWDRLAYALRLANLLRRIDFLASYLVHETEYHWPDAPSAGELYNTGPIDQLADQALSYLARAASP